MRTFIILQKFPKRGSLVFARVLNQSFNFSWNEELKHYAHEVKTADEADKFFLGCHQLRGAFIPGFRVIDGKPGKASSAEQTEKVSKTADAAPAPKEEWKEPTPVPVVKETVEPKLETTKTESQPPATPAKGRGKKKGK